MCWATATFFCKQKEEHLYKCIEAWGQTLDGSVRTLKDFAGFVVNASIKKNLLKAVFHSRVCWALFRLRGAPDSHHAGKGMRCCHAVWRCTPGTAGGYEKEVYQ